MKKINIVLILLVFSLFFGCEKPPNEAIFSKLDSDGNYMGFNNLPESYTREQAIKDGCCIRINSQIVSGEKIWLDFISKSSTGKDSSIRVVSITNDESNVVDLYYENGYYRAFDSSSKDLKDNKFKYLLTLKGTLPNAAKSGTVTILTNDKGLTYKDIMWTVLSSNIKYNDSISPFEVIFFN